ncbi:MAG: hydroxyethylthiazole kinase [Halarsenatibacteraceae bacterium]
MELTDLFSDFAEESQDILNEIHDQKPLILQLTNEVTMNDCANITLNWGGLPVMSGGKEDAAEMVESASALLINIGTLNDYKLEVMLNAGKKANQLGIPIILDPVGAGATGYRVKSVNKLLNQLDFTVIKGNRSEIDILAGVDSEIRGVESLAAGDNYKDSARQLAKKYSTITVVTGAEDYITNSKKSINIVRGDKMLGAVVGTGCMLGSSLAVFAGIINYEVDLFKRIITAVYLYNLAGERAARIKHSPAAFKTEFMDSIYHKSSNLNL